MRILEVRNDVIRYQYFLTADDALTGLLMTEGLPKLEDWQPPEVFIYEPMHKVGALYNYTSDCLIFPPAVAKMFDDYIFMAGEGLPLPYEDQIYTMLNITLCINCLDVARTEWISYYPETKQGRIKKHVFHQDHLPESILFKIPNSPRVVYVKEGHNSFDDAFFNLIKEHKLEGFIFREVWRSDDHEQ